jgi:hypothetical protein
LNIANVEDSSHRKKCFLEKTKKNPVGNPRDYSEIRILGFLGTLGYLGILGIQPTRGIPEMPRHKLLKNGEPPTRSFLFRDYFFPKIP